jgi:septal ring factor EnvC (AmiA/AmiB activator)
MKLNCRHTGCVAILGKCLPYIFVCMFCVLVGTSVPAQLVSNPVGQNDVTTARNQLHGVDNSSREILRSLHDINQKIRTVSKKRDLLTAQMFEIEGSVKSAADDVVAVETQIALQRKYLSRRMRALYLLDDEAAARVFFSMTDSFDLDETLRYLKLITDADYKQIKQYEKSRVELVKRRNVLRAKVKNLLSLKGSIKRQESQLNDDQKKKQKFLASLKNDRELTLKKIKELRKVASSVGAEFDLGKAIYEEKGQLTLPVKNATVKQGFGTWMHPLHRYRLAHKGVTFETQLSSGITNIFTGVVKFVGEMPGYGNTVIVGHGENYYSVYGYAKAVKVKEGQTLKSGDIVGLSTDRLHFELRHFSESIDPTEWFQPDAITKKGNAI